MMEKEKVENDQKEETMTKKGNKRDKETAGKPASPPTRSIMGQVHFVDPFFDVGLTQSDLILTG